jgi:nitroimidazol reductase NimA-like FMN-containing flavoprotein (pyridoxamine 5'-phosphate oxidase superfamily)
MGVTRKGPWNPDEIHRFLEAARVPARLACNGASGHPVIASLWFLSEGDRLWCATQRTARVVELLERDGRCAFEVAEDTPPYRGVRGQGHAVLSPERGESVLRRLIERYLGSDESEFAQWLLERADEEVAIGIEPDSLVSWDYTRRMQGAA